MTQIWGVNVPTKQTLQKYGLTAFDWGSIMLENVREEKWYCPVCDRTPPTGRTVVDHKHVPKWKTMPPLERRRWVRGVVCVTCNHFILTRYGTPEKFRRAAEYLERAEERWRTSTDSSGSS